MGFFDDAINKTKEIFDVACQKTGEVVSVEKLKFNVASLKSKCEKDYTDLGKIYFEFVKDSTDLDDNTRNIVDAIRGKSEEITRLNIDIQNAKNKVYCPNCGAGVAENSTYCNSCGAKMSD